MNAYCEERKAAGMAKPIAVMGLCLAAACGSVPFPDGGVLDTQQLTAVEPSIANTNGVIALEGSFGASVTVQFPGGGSRDAMVLGQHRAIVTVPATASGGDLTVTTNGSALDPMPFRRASFSLGIATFETTPEQSAGSRQGVVLTTPRSDHTAVVIGNYLYVVGGRSEGMPLAGLERAMINADGSLGPFAVVSDVALTTARYGHTSVVIGRHLYVLGGSNNTEALSSVESATINADGSLGAFTVATGAGLKTARQGHTSVMIGHYLYALGGVSLGNSYLNSVERAMIHRDGSLDAFVIVPDVVLATARANHTSAVIGSTLYVLGGYDGKGALGGLEQASIIPDGLVGPFTNVVGTTLFTARSGHTSIVLGEYLYVIGGLGSDGALTSVERAVIRVDGSLGTFAVTPEATLAAANNRHASTIVGNYLYVLGGLNNKYLNGALRATINTEGVLGAFTTIPATLALARQGHASLTIGRYLYVIGGSSGSTYLNSVERAMINADGSLGAFAIVPGVTLVTGRALHTSAVIGNYVYVMGGIGPSYLSSVERAAINADGSLSTFSAVQGVVLSAPRGRHTSVVIGNYLYVIGGINSSTTLATVERALINPDRSLSTFMTAPSVLSTARYGQTNAIIGHYLYIIAGNTSMGTLGTIERAMINSVDGSLGSFVTLPNITLRTSRYHHIDTVLGSYLYAIGGIGGNRSLERAPIGADGSPGTFVTVPTALTAARGLSSTVIIGNFLYIIGGLVGSAPVNSIERVVLGAE